MLNLQLWLLYFIYTYIHIPTYTHTYTDSLYVSVWACADSLANEHPGYSPLYSSSTRVIDTVILSIYLEVGDLYLCPIAWISTLPSKLSPRPCSSFCVLEPHFWYLCSCISSHFRAATDVHSFINMLIHLQNTKFSNLSSREANKYVKISQRHFCKM